MKTLVHEPDAFDAIIVGAGPAGLSAALVLGRCRRRVLVCDAGRYRNGRSHALHGFLTRDGIEPGEFLRIGHEQLQQYDTVTLIKTAVTEAMHNEGSFEVVLADGTRHRSRKLLLATGVVDHVPQIEGIDDLYGRSVFHCPYCDGWEVRDQPLAIYGRGTNGLGLALELTAWSRNLVLCTDASELLPRHRARLVNLGIAVRSESVARLEGEDGMLRRIVFASGYPLTCSAMFFSTGQHQASDLPASLGCEFTRKGAVRTGDYEASNIPGLYVAGDASKLVQFAIVAASEGAKAAFAINTALLKEDV